MTSFIDTSPTIYKMIVCILFLVCIESLVCAIMCASYRLKARFTASAYTLLSVSFAFLCMLYNGVLIKEFGYSPDDFVLSAYRMPAVLAIIITVVLAILSSLILALSIRRRKSRLTSMSVKDALDKLPVGICFYDETGLPVLMNRKIAQESKIITGKSLFNASVFLKNIDDGNVLTDVLVTKSGESSVIKLPNGEIRLYRKNEHKADGKTVYELISEDITEEYLLSSSLSEKNTELAKMNKRLREYGEKVTELTREKEILEAKVRIHDGMGELLLRTKKSLSEKEEYDKDSLIDFWEQSIKMLYEAKEDEDSSDEFSDLISAAKDIGVTVSYNGERIPEKSVAEKILIHAVHECLTNAVRHAKGDRLDIFVSESDTHYEIKIKNNGLPPSSEIVEGGGLSSLRSVTERDGGDMTVISAPEFALILHVLKDRRL